MMKSQDGPVDLREWDAGEVAYLVDIFCSVNIDEDNPLEGDSTVAMRALAQPRGNGRHSWPEVGGEWFEVRLRFVGVRDLRLNRFGPGLMQIMGFSIEDYRERAWEGVSYKVEDYEDGRISFYCKKVIVEARVSLQGAPGILLLSEP